MSGKMTTYSFLHHTVQVNGVPISGFSEGDDVLTTSYREDGVSDSMGADGEMLVAISADDSAEIGLKLQYTAASSDYLESLYHQFKQGRISGIRVSVYNMLTGKGEVSSTGYIPKIPDKARGKASGSMDWKIVVPKLAVQKPTLSINVGINL